MRAVILIAVLLLGGCATESDISEARAERQRLREQLARECAERGGELVSAPGADNPDERLNYVCERQHGSGKIPPR